MGTLVDFVLNSLMEKPKSTMDLAIELHMSYYPDSDCKNIDCEYHKIGNTTRRLESQGYIYSFKISLDPPCTHKSKKVWKVKD